MKVVKTRRWNGKRPMQQVAMRGSAITAVEALAEFKAKWAMMRAAEENSEREDDEEEDYLLRRLPAWPPRHERAGAESCRQRRPRVAARSARPPVRPSLSTPPRVRSGRLGTGPAGAMPDPPPQYPVVTGRRPAGEQSPGSMGGPTLPDLPGAGEGAPPLPS
ncbi:unnamed protein product [Urochloa humidicola]